MFNRRELVEALIEFLCVYVRQSVNGYVMLKMNSDWAPNHNGAFSFCAGGVCMIHWSDFGPLCLICYCYIYFMPPPVWILVRNLGQLLNLALISLTWVLPVHCLRKSTDTPFMWMGCQIILIHFLLLIDHKSLAIAKHSSLLYLLPDCYQNRYHHQYCYSVPNMMI